MNLLKTTRIWKLATPTHKIYAPSAVLSRQTLTKAFKNTKTSLKHLRSQIHKPGRFKLNQLLLATTSSLFLYQFYSQMLENNTALFFTDSHLQKVKRQIDSYIAHLKAKHGEGVMSFPKITYSLDGNTYKIEFLVDQRKCDIFSLVVLSSSILQNSEQRRSRNPQSSRPFVDIKSMNIDDRMTFLMEFQETDNRGLKKKSFINVMGEFSTDRPSFKFTLKTEGGVTDTAVEIIKQVYEKANRNTLFSTQRKSRLQRSGAKFSQNSVNRRSQGSQAGNRRGGRGQQQEEEEDPMKKLSEMGVTIFLPEEKGSMADLSWDMLAGYEKQKRDIEDTVLMNLTHPEIFDEITTGTRMRFERNRAKAVLFEGPPGTGKTTSAKIIASQVGIPLLYLPLESVMSKWYGEAEQRLATIFEKAGELGKSIIFIDEVDALAGSRDGSPHEVSRRILSTLLRKIDSFESDNDVMLICATNRKSDLDPAILSRLDLSIAFDLPDVNSRKEIFRRYAKHLSEQELLDLAQKSKRMSGRTIFEVCKDSERRWASKRIRKEVQELLPGLQQYLDSIDFRKKTHSE